jgi:hypothetical protein
MLTDCYSIFYFLNKEIFETRNKLNVTDLHKVHSLGMPQVDVYHILAGVEHGLPDFLTLLPLPARFMWMENKGRSTSSAILARMRFGAQLELT